MKYEDCLLERLENEGFTIAFYVDICDMNECDPEDAKEWVYSKYPEKIQDGVYDQIPEMFAKSLRLPKKMTVTYEWVMRQVYKESVFVSLAKHCAKLVKNHSLNVYPTSYGIGVSVIYNRNKSDNIKEVEAILDKLEIQYTNEYSSARWVYRFKISKSASNIEKMNAL